MEIRCERCSTMYDLDETLLAPAGSEVQCTKCQHVFTAFPPRAPGRTLVGVPAQQAHQAAPAPSRGPRAPASASPAASGPPGARRSDGPAATRGVRPAPPQVYRPAPPAPGAAPSTVGRSGMLRRGRDTVGTFEARLRWTARWRWLAPLLAVALVAVVAAAWWLLSRREGPSDDRTQREALALVALDDVASLDAATAKLAEVVERSPGSHAAAADLALAEALRAAAAIEAGEGVTSRLAARREERDRLRRDQPPGWEAAEQAASAEVLALERQVRTEEEQAKAHAASARGALAPLPAGLADTAEVGRAQAVLYAVAGERERLHKLVRAREKGARDAWLELADGWSDARDPDRGARERALVKLGALATARPDLLRGRYLLARAQASLGRKTEASATLDGVLAANARHEGARRLREELVRPVAASTPSPPAPAVAPSPPPPVVAPATPETGNAQPRPRKRATQRDAAASPSAPAGAPAPGGEASAPGDGTTPAPPAGSAPGPSAPGAAAPSAPAGVSPSPRAAEPPPSAPPATPGPPRRSADRDATEHSGG